MGGVMHRWAIWMSVAWSVLTVQAYAQNVGGLGQPWRGAGPGPCFGIDGGANKCPRGPQIVAIRAGRLFDSKSGSMLMVSDTPGPTGGIALQSSSGATISISDTGIVIDNGQGAMIELTGPSVTVNDGALMVT